jgi:hypothetical protein
MLASIIKMLSTIATYRGLSKPRSLPPAQQGKGPRHAFCYAVVRSHQARETSRFSATSGFPEERRAGSITRVPMVAIR